DLSFATADHYVLTLPGTPAPDDEVREMVESLANNTRAQNVRFFGVGDPRRGIVHVIGPEQGLTLPGMLLVCGDSHTATHGAFGALAFGIGSTEVEHVLATQTLWQRKPKVMRITVDGALGPGVTAKDVILAIIRKLGVNGGIGFCYEYGGDVIERMSMEERMSLCNMTIEGGARMGYVNPDQTTFDHLQGREFSPKGDSFTKSVKWWKSIASDSDARYDDLVSMDGHKIEPMVTWGINPGQAIGINENLPEINSFPATERETAEEAYQHMSLQPGQPILGTKIQVAFIGSCTNSRISDLREAAKVAQGKKVAPGIRALVVPGSQQIAKSAEAEGLDQIFTESGFEWRKAGCSMCLAMNPDKLQGREICASSSNRNFKGRQGSASGRTLLMSPAMVAAAALKGHLTDVREFLS
ncbi:MAG: 3-isopropylmalate dehydratase large subunit, partial [Elusimicrobia bacterium]|nr:3-isopropylmalate dehydratase large subunit [Elusimicrobiota bacterium]